MWDTATNEPPPGESPECQWCPICQAARAARMGGSGGLMSSLADAGGARASMAQDAFSAFEQIMKKKDQNRSAERTGAQTTRPGSIAPPPSLNRDGTLTLAIGVDVGGTKVAAGVVDENGRIVAKLEGATPAASPALTEQVIADVVERATGAATRSPPSA